MADLTLLPESPERTEYGRARVDFPSQLVYFDIDSDFAVFVRAIRELGARGS
jgi:hypothetical protein